ncbi:hypothetical protein KAH55_03285, partial [bacterium]|nr:hypothetical protein [bacterium]
VNGLQDAGEPAIPNVTVELYRTNGTLEATTTTDALGFYRFRVNPGDYYVKFIPISNRIFTSSNLGGNISIDSDANMETGITETTTLTPGEIDLTWDAGMVQPVEFHGLLWEDLDADGIQDTGENGRAGETVNLYCVTGDSIYGSTTTNANGEYSFINVPPNSFRVEFELPTGAKAFSPQDQGADDTADSDVDLITGRSRQYDTTPGTVYRYIDAGFYFPAAIGNRVWHDIDADGVQEAGESGWSGVTIELRDSGGTALGTSTTDGTGLYAFTDLTPGVYSLRYHPVPMLVSPQDQGGNNAVDSDFNSTTFVTITTELVSNENDDSWDLGLYFPVTIGDFVFEDLNANGIQDGGDQPIAGATVTLLNSDGSSTGLTTTTDASGKYEFGVADNLAPGSYIVEFTTPTGFLLTMQNQGSDDGLDSDADATTGRSHIVTLTSGQSDLTIDAGFVKPASVGDFIWNDLNFNGAQNSGEPGVSGVTVNLLNSSGTQLETMTTNNVGFYSFTNLFPGAYQIEVIKPANSLGFTVHDAPGVPAASNSDVDEITGLASVTLMQDMDCEDLDAGILYTGQLGDHVWLDRDQDGIFDSGEEPVENITVNLLDSTGAQISSMLTDIHGDYL